MVATTRAVFDKQLVELQEGVLRLSELVIEQIQQAVDALQKRNLDLAQRVEAFDMTINRLRYDLEEQCYILLALQQPNSRDMRRIVATVSFVTNLERMGDYAAGIARLVQRMSTMPFYVENPEFEEMATIATANLRNAMTAIATNDNVLAQAVVSRDVEIDRRHKAVCERLIRIMAGDRSTIECATMLMWVSHNLERYADRVSNICERALYLMTGDLNEPLSTKP